MGDYSCSYCQDRGDCTRCSHFFQPDAIHSKCGRAWKDHEVKLQPESNQGVYPPWAECPSDDKAERE